MSGHVSARNREEAASFSLSEADADPAASPRLEQPSLPATSSSPTMKATGAVELNKIATSRPAVRPSTSASSKKISSDRSVSDTLVRTALLPSSPLKKKEGQRKSVGAAKRGNVSRSAKPLPCKPSQQRSAPSPTSASSSALNETLGSYPQGQHQLQALQTDPSLEGAEGLLPKCSLPPVDRGGSADSSSSSVDRLDMDSLSTGAHMDGSGERDGAAARALASVTSLAGKRHTKVTVTPGPSHAQGSGGNSGGGAGNARRAGATSASTGGSLSFANGSGSASGNGNHRQSGESTLRYRTDLDKQVIHFMFERFQQEQVHPTTSVASAGVLSAPTTAANAAEAPGLRAESALLRVGRNCSSPAVTAASPSSTSPERVRRVTVEEVCLPVNKDTEDKNIGVGDWNFFWMHVGRVRHTVCSSDFRWQDQQIINHFPDHAELTRKDLMYKNIKRYLRENQANDYARLTLHTATDWASAAAIASAEEKSALGSTGFPPLAASGASRGRPPLFSSFCFADSVPLTYNIPNDLNMFKEESLKHLGMQWIVKPTSRSQGKGIFLINDARTLQRWVREKKAADNAGLAVVMNSSGKPCGAAGSGSLSQRSAMTSTTDAAAAFSMAGGSSRGRYSSNNGDPQASWTMPDAHSPGPTAAAPFTNSSLGSYVVSRYVSNPLLIGGKKFDLRLYVLVTSYRPLVAYLHEDGFARFCATRYMGNSLAQEDLGSHLTNVALQKGDEHYNTSHGGKWSFQQLFLYVQVRYGPYVAEAMMQNIQFLIYHSLRAVEPVVFNDKHSYELYGYDILIDDQIKPHLIEVNASPSMSTTTVADRLLKEQVLTDTLKILLPPGFPGNNRGMPYWEYRHRTDLTTQLQTGFKLLKF